MNETIIRIKVMIRDIGELQHIVKEIKRIEKECRCRCTLDVEIH